MRAVSRTWKLVILGLAAVLVLNIALGAALRPGERGAEVPLSGLLDAIDSGQVTRAEIGTGRATIELSSGRKLHSDFPDTYNDDLIALLHQRRAEIEVKSDPSWFIVIAVLVPFGLFAAFWVWLGRRLPPRARDDAPAPTASAA
jgi:hypothetical protein